jgi:KDO2-lipid IV(A) lauroyltransferase
VGKKLFDKRLDALISRTRHVRNIDYLHRNTSFRRIISRLRSGETFGVVIDQDTRVEGVFVRFLGRNAYTPSGAVKLAMRYDIPVFTATITRRHDHTHDIRISDQIPLFHGYDPTRNLLISLQIINNILSHTIIAHPSQWVWMHARWKRRPESPRYASQPCIDRPGPGPDQETDNRRMQG